MGLWNNWVHRQLKKEAMRLADEAVQAYSQAKLLAPNRSNQEILLSMNFEAHKFEALQEESKERILVCFETLQGYCCFLGLIAGRVSGFTDRRALQFMRYVDIALTSKGVPRQTPEQRARMLASFNFTLQDWQDVNGGN